MGPPLHRGPFTKTEFAYLFEKTNFAKFQKRGYPSHYWAPMLAAFTGARRSEIFFLTIDDIKEKHGIHFISINDNDDKKIKTTTSIRTVPIHKKLVELGFLEYVEKVHSRPGASRLFPEYKDHQGQAGYKFTDAFGRFIKSTREQLSEDQQKDFDGYRGLHSFRHLFVKETREIEMSDAASRILVGHSKGTDVHEGYGGPASEKQEKP